MNTLSKFARFTRVAWNILRARYVKPVPVFCSWETTYSCNMKCGFCCVDQHKGQWMPELSTEQALDIINQLADLGTSIVNFSGGEPLLRKDINLLIAQARKRNLLVFMNSNGTYVKDNIEKVKGLDLLRISIDSVENEHDALRQDKGAFQLAVESIKAAKSAGIKTMINTVVTKNLDFEKYRYLAELAKSLDIQISYSLINVDLPTIREPKPSDLDIDQRVLMSNEQEFIEIIIKLQKEFGNTIASPHTYLMLIEKGGLDQIGCRNMDIAISLKPDGSVSIPCPGFPHRVIKGKIADIWYGAEAVKARKEQGHYWFCKRCLFRCTSFATMLLDNKMLFDLLISWKRSITS